VIDFASIVTCSALAAWSASKQACIAKTTHANVTVGNSEISGIRVRTVCAVLATTFLLGLYNFFVALWYLDFSYTGTQSIRLRLNCQIYLPIALDRFVFQLLFSRVCSHRYFSL